MNFPKINSFPLFWENGMKLSATHFQHLEESIEDAVRDSRALGLSANDGYGLLPHSPFSLQSTQGAGPQSVKVILNACRAVLPGGYRVEILPENVQQLQLPLKTPSVEFAPVSEVRYHLFLCVDESKRIPAGVPQIMPIRHPHIVPAYYLECVPHDKLSAVHRAAPNRMKIGEWQNQKLIEGYIPPTLTINGLPVLDKWHQYLSNLLENMVRLALQAVAEYRNKDAARLEFCLSLVQFIRGSQGYFKWVLPHQSPLYLAGYFGNLAGMVEGMIESCDRDFIRNQLKDGQAHNLRPSIHALQKPAAVPREEMAIMLGLIKNFCDAMILTLEHLVRTKSPDRKLGDINPLGR